MRFRQTAIAGVLALASGLCGCATSSSLSNMWKDPTYQAGPMKTILVIALKPDPAKRRLYEDRFAAAISKYGTVATPSYRLFPNLPDTAAVREAVRRDHYEGVLTVSKADTSVQSTYVQGYTNQKPVPKYNPLTFNYEPDSSSMTPTGYEETETILRHEIHLWQTANGGRLVWAATGESINPASHDQVVNECEKLVLPALSHAGFIGK